MKRICFWLIFFLLLVTKSYSQSFEIKVNSISQNIIDIEKTYFLRLGDSVKNEFSDISNARYIRLIEKVLGEKGYTRVIDTFNLSFNYFIDFNYFIKHSKTFEVKNTSGTGYNNNVNININNNSPTYYGGNIKPIEYQKVDFSKISNSNREEITESIQLYKRFFTLSCLQKNRLLKNTIWIVETESEGNSDDLREVVPVLIFSSKDYIESDSGSVKSFSLKANNKSFKSFLSSY